MKITVTNETTKSRRYTACAMGNGSLSFLVDSEGIMKSAPWFEDIRGVPPNIWQAGVRYDTIGRFLVGLGAFTQELAGAGKPEKFTQTFIPEQALLSGTVQYAGNIEISTRIFCHLRYNVIVVHKKIVGTAAPFRFRYRFDAPRVMLQSTVRTDSTAVLAWSVDTRIPQSGEIRIFADVPSHVTLLPDGCTVESEEREVTFYICFDHDAEEFVRLQREWQNVFKSHCELWADFWRESTLRLPEDTRLAQVCRMAEYHLRISTTAWSIPVGIYPTHWQGRYYGFDEFFAFDGLLATGHLSAARRVPEFRYHTLPQAKMRISRYSDPDGECAEYPWQADEEGYEEIAEPGFWLKHIFHMAHIALSALRYSLAADDMKFLRDKGYPVIRACAEYYRQHHLYRLENARCVVGKCTDLERLGPARENAFMTTCGVIATLHAAADTAERFGLDAPLVAEWRQWAGNLKRSLPENAGRYAPYPGCAEPSIAVLAGIYPYEEVISLKDGKFLAALHFFLDNAERSGNMYPFGKSVCAWYGAWSVIVLFRLGRCQEARQLLEKLAEDTGCFAETYEIYETGNTPYFTTAEGIFLKAAALVTQSGESDQNEGKKSANAD